MQKKTNFNYAGNSGVKRGDFQYQERGNLLKTGEMAITSNYGILNIIFKDSQG